MTPDATRADQHLAQVVERHVSVGWLIVPPALLSIAAFALAFYIVHSRYHDTGGWISVVVAPNSATAAWVYAMRLLRSARVTPSTDAPPSSSGGS